MISGFNLSEKYTVKPEVCMHLIRSSTTTSIQAFLAHKKTGKTDVDEYRFSTTVMIVKFTPMEVRSHYTEEKIANGI